MNGDQLIDDKLIELVQSYVRSHGSNAVGEQWAQSEFNLYIHMLAGTARIEHYLERKQVSAEVVLTLRREILTLLLECAEAIRRANIMLWDDFVPDGDPSTEGGAV